MTGILPMPELTIIHIFSASYSGSTWLNLMLGSHPDAFSVGEVKTILKIGSPVCTLHGGTCAIWRPDGVDGAESFYAHLAAKSGKRIFIVNNSRKWFAHEDAPGIRGACIHLVRDGRAVVASRMRKGVDRSFIASCRRWKSEVRRCRRVVRRRGAGFTVRYEDLIEATGDTLSRVCRQVGIEYHPAMLEFWKPDHCFLGGNRGTLHSMLRLNGRRLPEDPERMIRKEPGWDMGFYDRVDPTHFRDERWREELTPRQLWGFSILAGRFNRKLGY